MLLNRFVTFLHKHIIHPKGSFMKFRFFLAGIILAIGSAFAQTPPAPTNLTAVFEAPSPATLGDVKLEWQMSAGQWRFKIYRSTNDTLHYQVFATTGDRLFRDYNIVPGTRYNYYVRATTATQPIVEGPRSNVVNVLVPVPPPPPRRGFIVGTVRDDSTSAPIPRVLMRFYRTTGMWNMSPDVLTDSLGRYRAVLDTGRYIVRATPICSSTTPCYYAEYYNNVREPQQATPVPVGDSTTFTANFGLSRIVPPTYSYISGTVRDTLGAPLRRASVAIMRTMQNMNTLSASGWNFSNEVAELEGIGHTRGVMWRGVTDSNGNYRTRVIAGRYIALASKEHYIPEYFNNKPTAQLADIINATHDTTGVNFSLALRPVPQNSISGIVRDSLGTRVPSRIALYPARRDPYPIVVRYGHTDSLGVYTLSNVEAGKYFVFAAPFHGFAPAYYKANAYGISRREQADTVNVTGNVVNINVGVRPVHSNGIVRLGGFIRNTANVSLAGVSVVATENGEVAGIGVSDGTGAYSIDAIVSGDVTLTADRDGYASKIASITIAPSTYSVDNVNVTLSPSGPTSVSPTNEIPSAFGLEQNYPNPFNPSTNIEFRVAAPGLTTFEVYNLLGQKVATLVNEMLTANTYTISFDASRLGSGTYFYKLTSGSFVETKKMVLMK